ncbi:MAG TPA: cation transporter [Candidatus Pelethosoma merdigallinarum]|nr:cation transporter [Candidatus Pelethosoma merdigallinarum]
MNKEFKVLVFSMIMNLLISILKIVGGIYFHFGSLLADGMQTFSDFVTDIVSFIGAKFSKKRPTKSHPFGFGKMEYITNLVVGFLLFSLAIFIIINGYMSPWHIPSLSVLWILVIAFVLKGISIYFLYSVGKKINSQLLITSYSESKMDLYASSGVMLATILLQFSESIIIFRSIDMIVGFIIGFMVLKTSWDILRENSMNLIGKVEDNTELYKKIEDFLLDMKGVEKVKMYLIRYGKYYKIQLMIEMDPKLTLRQVTKLEEKIKRELVRHHSFHVKYPTIYVTSHLED